MMLAAWLDRIISKMHKIEQLEYLTCYDCSIDGHLTLGGVYIEMSHVLPVLQGTAALCLMGQFGVCNTICCRRRGSRASKSRQ